MRLIILLRIRIRVFILYKILNNNSQIQEMHQPIYNQKLLTPLKQNAQMYQPQQEQIQSYAKFVLGLDLNSDQELFYLAKQALKAPLPQEWEACEYAGQLDQQNDQEPQIVYRNKVTKQISNQHPLDVYYRQKALQLKMIRQIYHADPIHEDMMESSINFKKLENSSLKKSSKITVQNKLKISDKIKNQSDKYKYNNSSLNSAKSIQFDQNNSQKSKRLQDCFCQELSRNITEESVYDELDNFSMITQRKQQQNRQNSKNQINVVRLSPKKMKKQRNQPHRKKEQVIAQHQKIVKQLKKKLYKYDPQELFKQLMISNKEILCNFKGFSQQKKLLIQKLHNQLNKIKIQNLQLDVKIQEMAKLAEIKQRFK